MKKYKNNQKQLNDMKIKVRYVRKTLHEPKKQ